MPTTHSTGHSEPKKARRVKPKKPRRDFPLYAHPNGQWCKTIAGKKHYFGVWEDPEAAEALYDREKDFLRRGVDPPLANGDGVSVREACNKFLASKKAKLEAGELSKRHYKDLHAAANCMCAEFGSDTPLASLLPDHFIDYRSKLAKKWKTPAGLTREIANRKSILTYAYKNDLVEYPVKTGTEFAGPNKNSFRKHQTAIGYRDIDVASLRKIIGAAKHPLKAMILLALNGGFGNTDLAFMPHSVIDLEAGWIRYPRGKTGKPRAVPLWPETIAAVREAIDQRPQDRTRDTAELLFLTRQGRPWGTRDNPNAAITHEFRKLLDDLGLYRRGLSFYSLRHSHRTISSDARDREASDCIMGHDDGTMASHYVQRVLEPRLVAVTDHIRAQVFGEAGDAGGQDHE